MTEADWPEEIRLSPDKTLLTLVFADGSSHALAAEYLRVESPSAEVQGHGPDQKTVVAGKRMVGISDIEPVGNYAVRIVFDDGHDPHRVIAHGSCSTTATIPASSPGSTSSNSAKTMPLGGRCTRTNWLPGE